MVITDTLRSIFLYIYVVGAFLTMVAIGYIILQNWERSNELEQIQVEQCKEIFRGIDSVFVVFFPPPSQWTEKQAETYDKFFDRTRMLRDECEGLHP